MDETDPDIPDDILLFDASIERLRRAGALVIEKPLPAFDRSAECFKGGGYAGAEAYAIHRHNAARLGEYDPRVAKRVLMGKELSAADYVDFGLMRAQFQREVEAALAPFDAFLLPTTPCIAPPIAEVNATMEDETERRGIAFVDISSVADRADADPSLVASDGLHPSGAQYAGWVDLIAPVAARLLGGSDRP